MILAALFFYLFAGVCVASAFMVIASRNPVHSVLFLILAFVNAHAGAKDRPVLAGNSIHQDRRFIRRYMPALDLRLHYRMVDVSTIKELARRWFPQIAAKQPQKNETHRALDDIRESIDELRFYRANVFAQPPVPAPAPAPQAPAAG